MSQVIPDEAVEAAARGMCGTHPLSQWVYQPQTARDSLMEKARQALEAAAPHMLSHERQQTADAHRDAMVNAERLGKHEALVADLHYIADHKAADNKVGRWWAEVIRGAIAKNIR